MDRIVHVGLIGFGLAGRVFHAPIISSVPGLKLRKIFERKDENVAIIKENTSNYNSRQRRACLLMKILI